MKIGRNDPCPCGSGKKYKRCCLERDRAAGAGAGERRLLDGEAERRVAEAQEWQADVLPVGGSLGEDPTSRLAVALVTAAGFAIEFKALDHPSPEPEAMAEDLAAVLDVAADRVGGWPEAVCVRWPDVAQALRRRFAEGDAQAGPEVEVGPLPEIDQVGGALLANMGAHPSAVGGGVFACSPDTWAAWDLPPELVARIFAAAAAFYRAAPWKVHANLDILEATAPGGRTWTACIMGQGGREYGLALYAEADDFFRTVGPVDGPDEGFGGVRSPVITLLLDPGHELPKRLRREVSAAGWELAGPRAYPHVITLNTPAGGLRREHAEDLAALLEAVPRFVAEHSGAVEEARPVEGWRDRKTGARLSYHAEARVLAQLTEELAESPFSRVGELAPGGPEGPGADPEAAVHPPAELAAAEAFIDAELAVIERFAGYLHEVEGLAASTVKSHTANARIFVEFLAGQQGAPVRAVHEYDLRFFLFDVFHREVAVTESQGRSMPVSLERFFEFLAAEEGIVCPWADGVLGERRAYEERRRSYPGGAPLSDEVMDWRGDHDEELYARLLLPDTGLGEDDEWGEIMGRTEFLLRRELHRRWLLWRDREIRSGRTESRELLDVLLARQRSWEADPQPALGGKSPRRAIRGERRERGRAGKGS
jgi:hypothetical protein